MLEYMNFFLRRHRFSVVLCLVSFNILFAQELFSDKNRSVDFYGNAVIYPEQKSSFTMASGVEYSPKKLTVAHKDLPFGTRLLVRNLSNNQFVEVLVMDRGPYDRDSNKVLVLSRKAAEIIGALPSDGAFIKATILEMGNNLRSPVKPYKNFSESLDIPENFSNDGLESSSLQEENIFDVVPMDPDSLLEKGLESSDVNYLGQNINTMSLDETVSFPEITPQDTPYDSVQYQDNSIYSPMTNPAMSNPEGLKQANSDIILDDPLEGIDLGIEADEEFVVAPSLSDKDISRGMSPEEELFSIESSQNYRTIPETETQFFNSELNSSLASPIQNTQNVGSNLDADNFGSSNSMLSSLSQCPPPRCCPSVPAPPPQQCVPCPPIVEHHTVYPPVTVPTVVSPSPTCIHVTCNHGCDAHRDQNIEPCRSIHQCSSNCCSSSLRECPKPSSSRCSQRKASYLVQVGAFGQLHNALNLYSKLKCQNYDVFLSDICSQGMTLTRVRIGYFNTMEQAKCCAKRLKSQGYKARVVRSDS